METQINVPEIHCDHCKSSIEGAVAAITGVEHVEVDIDGRRVDVSFDDSQTEVNDIIGAIEEQGYEVPAQS
ncbi:MAG: copper ion binding protein [Acidimicrobiia bacterium]|nr:copper ion binding protein [Acidimicrobiia bacterium]